MPQLINLLPVHKVVGVCVYIWVFMQVNKLEIHYHSKCVFNVANNKKCSRAANQFRMISEVSCGTEYWSNSALQS